MYRHLAVLTVLILSLSACGSNEAPQPQHDASLGKALTTIATVEAEETPAMPSVNCPVTNNECNSTPEKCAEMGIQCPKVNTENSECPPAAVVNCPSMGDKGCPKTAEMTDVVEPETAEAVVERPTTSILTLRLENDFGAVFVPHRQHVEMYGCEVCHPTEVPGKIEKTKKEFHALCRKCHAEEKSGPTKCRGCHQR